MGEGKQFGRYEVRATIGRGSMGVVYLAEDPVIDRKVAIKVVEAHGGLDTNEREQLQARFQREFQSAGRLSHPNIVSVHDVGQQDGNSFIAMEYIQGESLSSILADNRTFSFKEVADLTAQVCSALDYAHQHSIVHRDIKPANILITLEGRPKITDFGVAKVTTTTLTRTGTVVGTPAYMSPEQVTGHPVTGAADQFSLAVLVYQLLTGERPFTGENPTTIMYKIVHEEPVRPSALNRTLPGPVDQALMRALSKSPDGRYPTCTGLADAFRAALGAAPAEATAVMATEGVAAAAATDEAAVTVVDPSLTPSRRSAPARVERRDRGLPIGGLFVVGLVIVAIATGLWAWNNGKFDEILDAAGFRDLVASSTAPARLPPTLSIIAAAGLEIWVDGANTGETTPASIDLEGSAGESRTVQLRLGDEVLASQSFTLSEDLESEWRPTGVEAAMVAAGISPAGSDVDGGTGSGPGFAEGSEVPVTFMITSNPPGARVTFDGSLLRTTTPVEVGVDLAAEHSIVIVAEGYDPMHYELVEGQLTDAQRQSHELHFPLTSSVPPGFLSIDNRFGYPVELTITPRDREGSPLTQEAAISHNIQLPPGSYDVLISAPSILWSDQRIIDIDSEATKSTALPPSTTVRVIAEPGNCIVSIDGTRMGPPPFDQELAVGMDYTFFFDWTDIDRGTQEQTVKITRDMSQVSGQAGDGVRRAAWWLAGGAH